jgi:transcriptional regulator with XRE-family HTH domain
VQANADFERILIALGQRVRELRAKRQWSQERFADITGVHRTWMGAVERGERNFSFHNLVLISNALGISLSTLLTGVDQHPAGPAKRLQKDK